jgi:hypothetical protein
MENIQEQEKLHPELFKAYIDKFDSVYYPECIGILADKVTLAQLNGIQQALNKVYQIKTLKNK